MFFSKNWFHNFPNFSPIYFPCWVKSFGPGQPDSTWWHLMALMASGLGCPAISESAVRLLEHRLKLYGTIWNSMEFWKFGKCKMKYDWESLLAFLFSHLFDVFVWPSIHKTSPTSKMWGSAFNWLVVKEWSFTMWMVVANCGPVQSKHPRSLRMQCATGHTPSVQTQFFAPFAFPITEI